MQSTRGVYQESADVNKTLLPKANSKPSIPSQKDTTSWHIGDQPAGNSPVRNRLFQTTRALEGHTTQRAIT